MTNDELSALVLACGGGGNAQADATNLNLRIQKIEKQSQYTPLLKQLRAAREQGDFRGRVLEINFIDHFSRHGITLDYAVRQHQCANGDVDFGWHVGDYRLCIETKMLRKSNAYREKIEEQLGLLDCYKISTDNMSDVVRLQRDILSKASITKFNPCPAAADINLVAIDACELISDMLDVGDCLLAAGGNPLFTHHFPSDYRQENVVGIFEDPEELELTIAQKNWVDTIQRGNGPHPRVYLHGILFLFRDRTEPCALSYDLESIVIWNHKLVTPDVQRQLGHAVYGVIPSRI